MSEPISKGGTAHPRLTRQQKAAAVIVSLGTDKASQLYQYMDPEDVEQITLEVAKLGYLDSSATEDVLTEYYQMCMTNKAVTEGGLEYARAVLEKAFGQQTATSLLEKVTKSLKNREFAFLNKADEKSLYAALQHERPQTIALVLSYVDAEKSAAVIEELDDERQVRVIENMANMESASPTAVKIIEAEMEKKFSSLMTASNVKVGGVDFVADVMNNLDRSSEKNIFDRLAEYNEPLADEIRKRMFVFEDIVTMDDRSVQRSGAGAQGRKQRCGQQNFHQYVGPHGAEHPGGSGDHQQCPHPGRGGGPAAHCWDHPGLGGTQRADHPQGRKGRYHCLIFLRAS